jgi:hypothetical protein
MVIQVLTPDEKLATLRWPRMESTDRIALAPEDWFIVCAGFEDRTLSVLEREVGSQTPFRVLLILYKPSVPENKEGEIREICRRAGIQPVEVIYNRHDQAGFGRVLLENLGSRRGRVVVDVSAMSRLLIVQVLVALGSRAEGFRDCFVAYAEAKLYPPSQAEAEAELARAESDPTLSILFLSSGIFGVSVVPELSASGMPGAQTRLISFPTLDDHHLIALRAELQPSRFSFIEGVPPRPENRWRQEFIKKINRLADIKDAEICETSTLLYEETLHCLLELYRKHAVRERLLLSPTGSKMQTVAVGVFRTFVTDVQIVYPTPRGFRSPENYTSGADELHLLPLEAFKLDES